MEENKRKRIVDDILNKFEAPKEKLKLVKVESKENSAGESLSTREIINKFSEDYDKKLNIGLNLKSRGEIEIVKFTPKEEALPFLVHGLDTSMHIIKHLDKIAKISRINVEDLEDEIVMPIMIVCSTIAYRIHSLNSVPYIDISEFDTSRINIKMEVVKEIIKEIENIESSNKHKWISILCFDSLTLILNTLSTVFGKDKVSPFIRMLYSATFVPALSSLTIALMKNMVQTSKELDKM